MATRMTPNHTPEAVPNMHTAYFWSGDALRSRSVADVVLSGTVDIPVPPARLVADWERDIAQHLDLEPGDVGQMPLARARRRWPDYSHCVQAAADWTRQAGLADTLGNSEIALMACCGARYHHDGVQYGGSIFCNLFVSEDKGLDVHFPTMGLRIPLARGTILVFDTGQPHAVIARSSPGFAPEDFSADRDCSQLFLTWELPVECASVARTMGIIFDTHPTTARTLNEAQVWVGGAQATVQPASGEWDQLGFSSDPPMR